MAGVAQCLAAGSDSQERARVQSLPLRLSKKEKSGTDLSPEATAAGSYQEGEKAELTGTDRSQQRGVAGTALSLPCLSLLSSERIRKLGRGGAGAASTRGP